MKSQGNASIWNLVAFACILAWAFLIIIPNYCQASDWTSEHVASWMVGTGADLEFDHDNNPLMVYPDRDRGKIVLAYRINGQWQFVDIDGFPSSMTYAGLPSPSLAINPRGGWGVAYYVENSDDSTIGTLKYASGIGLSFTTQVVEENISLGIGGYRRRLSLKFSPQGVPSIAFLRGFLNTQLCLAVNNGSNWEINVVVDPNNYPSLSSDWPIFSITGGLCLAFDSQGHAIIAYEGFFSNSHATKAKEVMQVVHFSLSPDEQSQIEIETVDSFEQSFGDNLQFTYPFLALDSQGSIGLSYIKGTYGGGSSFDEYDLQVNFARFNGESWEISTVEHLNVFISSTLLVFDRGNNPLIAYSLGEGADDNSIHFAKRDGNGWDIDTIGSTHVYGPIAYDLAIDNNNIPYLSYSTAGEIQLARYGGEMTVTTPTVPGLSLATNGMTVNLSWTTASGSDGYTLLYAPYPDARYIGSFDMGQQTSFSVDLWPGAAFYVAVQAYNGAGNSDYSNIEYFVIP